MYFKGYERNYWTHYSTANNKSVFTEVRIAPRRPDYQSFVLWDYQRDHIHHHHHHHHHQSGSAIIPPTPTPTGMWGNDPFLMNRMQNGTIGCERRSEKRTYFQDGIYSSSAYSFPFPTTTRSSGGTGSPVNGGGREGEEEEHENDLLIR